MICGAGRFVGGMRYVQKKSDGHAPFDLVPSRIEAGGGPGSGPFVDDEFDRLFQFYFVPILQASDLAM